MPEQDAARFWTLLREFDTAMLVTISPEQLPRARPMAIAGADEDPGLIYFASRTEDGKLDEILACAEVGLTMQDGNRYLSVSGRAQVETNRALAEELWSPSMKLWFPEGPADPKLSLLVFQPLRGEYWDRAGLLQLQFLWEAGKALLKGEKLPDERLSGHAKVRPK